MELSSLKKIKFDRDKATAALQDLYDNAPQEPVRRRYYVTDSTVEKLSIIQSENPMGILVLRDELTGWLRSIDREDRSEDRAYYLAGWNGTDSWDANRITRNDVSVPSHVISVFGGIQPDKLAPYLRAMADGNGNYGLMQRFQVAVYPDPTTPKPVDASPDEDARTLARRVFSNLDALPEHDGNDMPTVRFTDSAYQDFWDWYCDTIKRADSEPSVHMEAHLAKYASLMPSIALVIELAEQASSGTPDIHTLTVSDTSSARAIAWCKYLETHARRIYGLVDDPLATARELLLKLPLMQSPFRVRDVVRSNWSGLSDTKEVTTAAEQLCKYYCLDRQEVKTGGRPSALYHIHPDIQHRESKSKEGV